ncbi:nuclear pore complex protein NUP1-like isoform X2 [Fagus crenata]
MLRGFVEKEGSFSTVVAGVTNSVPTVTKLEKADNKNHPNVGVTFRTPEIALSFAASTSTPTASIGANTFQLSQAHHRPDSVFHTCSAAAPTCQILDL